MIFKTERLKADREPVCERVVDQFDLPGTVITLAHELQHFSQYGRNRAVWDTNTFIPETTFVQTMGSPFQT